MSKITHVRFHVEAYNAMARIMDVMHPGVRDALAIYMNSREEISEPNPEIDAAPGAEAPPPAVEPEPAAPPLAAEMAGP